MIPLPLPQLKRCMERWQEGLHGQGRNSLFLDNHDLPRIVSRWGDDGKYRVESAKMLATMLYGMEGTPYIYQGEELGMTNIQLPISQYQDVEILNMYHHRMEEGYPEEEVMPPSTPGAGTTPVPPCSGRKNPTPASPPEPPGCR